MKAPHRINRHLIMLVMLFCDVLCGISLMLSIRMLYPNLGSLLPRTLINNSASSFFAEPTFYSLYWIILFAMTGYYRKLFQKGIGLYMMGFLGMLLIGELFLIFICFINNDFLSTYGHLRFLIEMTLLTSIIYAIPRLVYYLVSQYLTKKGKLATYVVLIGNTYKSLSIKDDLTKYSGGSRCYIVGYISSNHDGLSEKEMQLQKLGTMDEIADVLNFQTTDEVVVAYKANDHLLIQKILNVVKQNNITLRLLPDITSILEGSVKMTNLKGIPFITIRNNLMPEWQQVFKVVIDYLTAICAIIASLPLLPIIIFGIKFTSSGPIFYSQTRLGKNRKPFKIIKFRSMYVNAEQQGPSLSSNGDPRITPFGRIMRKWRMDEIPQFANVLKGEMSVVGPRPERKFFVDQIVKQAPYYTHLFRIKPGITSWGMVKYGYAENIEQMVARSKYDIIYLENMTLMVDLKIIAHTIKTIFLGNGK